MRCINLASVRPRKLKLLCALIIIATTLCVFMLMQSTSSICSKSFISGVLRTRENPQLKVKCYTAGMADYERQNTDRIFFHETTRRTKLNERQSCAVESAALHNPEKPVQLFMLHTEHLDRSSSWFKVLAHYPNFEIILIKEDEYFRNSPLETWFENGEWQTSPHSHIHLADYLRILSEYKGGGLYLDLDVITFKRYDLKEMGDFFALQEKSPLSLISNAVFHLNSSHRFLKVIISKLAKNYDPDLWAHHGTFLITPMLHHYCGFSRFKYPITNNCTDIKILPIESFYAVQPSQFSVMYERVTNETASLFNDSYGVHEWNSKSRHEFIDMQSDQLYSIIAREHCPLTAELLAKCPSN